jgi:P27 family predicted phage terminase small subunit
VKRKSINLKILEGNPGKRPLTNAPKPAPISPACPKWLPTAAKKIYKELSPILQRLGLLTEVDGTAFADFCLCLARLREAEADIQERGLLVPGDRGLVKNPCCQLARDYRTAAQKWAKRFGLDPASRGALDVYDEGPDKDDMESLLSGI